MDIRRLPDGERAPTDSDCISVEAVPGGKFKLNGSVLLNCGDGEAEESVALIGGTLYDSFDAAEAAGLAWAADHCADTVYISTVDAGGTGAEAE